MEVVQLQCLVESFTTFGLVIWEVEGVELRVKFANRIARDTLGSALSQAPRSDLDRILRASMLRPGEEMRAEVKDLVHATSGARFGLLARVVGLSGTTVCAHLHTSDFPLVVVEEPKDRQADVVAMAVAAVNPFALGRQKREEVQRVEEMIGGTDLYPIDHGSFDRMDIGSLGSLSLEFLLQGSRGSSDMLESLPCPSMEWDGAGNCLSANRGLRAMLGAGPADPLEFANASVCVDEAQLQKVRDALAQLRSVAFDSSAQRSVDVTLHRMDGSVVGANLTLSKPSSPNPNAPPIICVQALL